MSPVGDGGYRNIPNDHKKAAVLVLIHHIDGVPHIVFMKRTSHHPQDKHAGQISFPGGALDPEDKNLLDCAQRETFEEVGVKREAYELIGALSPLYVYVSKFLMFPFVAYTKKELNFIKEDEEVDRVISWPLELFLSDNSKKHTDIQIRNTTLKNVPHFNYDNEILWGATAMVMAEFILIIKMTSE